MADQTGITGTVDFALEWSAEPNGGAGPAEVSPVEILVVDHIERPSGN